MIKIYCLIENSCDLDWKEKIIGVYTNRKRVIEAANAYRSTIIWSEPVQLKGELIYIKKSKEDLLRVIIRVFETIG